MIHCSPTTAGSDCQSGPVTGERDVPEIHHVQENSVMADTAEVLVEVVAAASDREGGIRGLDNAHNLCHFLGAVRREDARCILPTVAGPRLMLGNN